MHSKNFHDVAEHQKNDETKRKLLSDETTALTILLQAKFFLFFFQLFQLLWWTLVLLFQQLQKGVKVITKAWVFLLLLFEKLPQFFVFFLEFLEKLKNRWSVKTFFLEPTPTWSSRSIIARFVSPSALASEAGRPKDFDIATTVVTQSLSKFNSNLIAWIRRFKKGCFDVAFK